MTEMCSLPNLVKHYQTRVFRQEKNKGGSFLTNPMIWKRERKEGVKIRVLLHCLFSSFFQREPVPPGLLVSGSLSSLDTHFQLGRGCLPVWW